MPPDKRQFLSEVAEAVALFAGSRAQLVDEDRVLLVLCVL